MFMYGLMFWLMFLSQMETENSFGGSTTEANKITLHPIPKQMLSARDKTGRKFHRQWPMTGAGDVFTKLLFVRRENANAAPPARNSHIEPHEEKVSRPVLRGGGWQQRRLLMEASCLRHSLPSLTDDVI
jgi:hypothetical protein